MKKNVYVRYILQLQIWKIIDCLHTLIMARSNNVTIEGFEMEVDIIINSIHVNVVFYYRVVLSITYVIFILNMNS